jgi:hypothetical protein
MEFILSYDVFSVTIAVSAESDVVDNDDDDNRCTVVAVVVAVVVGAILP